jgi:hypothetical protein
VNVVLQPIRRTGVTLKFAHEGYVWKILVGLSWSPTAIGGASPWERNEAKVRQWKKKAWAGKKFSEPAYPGLFIYKPEAAFTNTEDGQSQKTLRQHEPRP